MWTKVEEGVLRACSRSDTRGRGGGGGRGGKPVLSKDPFWGLLTGACSGCKRPCFSATSAPLVGKGVYTVFSRLPPSQEFKLRYNVDKGDPIQATKLLSASEGGVFSLCFAPRWMLLPPKMQRYETKEMIRLHRCTSPWPHRQAAQSPGAAMESSKLMDGCAVCLEQRGS